MYVEYSFPNSSQETKKKDSVMNVVDHYHMDTKILATIWTNKNDDIIQEYSINLENELVMLMS